jgi:hypothetical protein
MQSQIADAIYRGGVRIGAPPDGYLRNALLLVLPLLGRDELHHRVWHERTDLCCDHRYPLTQRRAVDLLAAAEDGVSLWQVAAEFVAPSSLAPGLTASA